MSRDSANPNGTQSTSTGTSTTSQTSSYTPVTGLDSMFYDIANILAERSDGTKPGIWDAAKQVGRRVDDYLDYDAPWWLNTLAYGTPVVGEIRTAGDAIDNTRLAKAARAAGDHIAAGKYEEQAAMDWLLTAAGLIPGFGMAGAGLTKGAVKGVSKAARTGSKIAGKVAKTADDNLIESAIKTIMGGEGKAVGEIAPDVVKQIAGQAGTKAGTWDGKLGSLIRGGDILTDLSSDAGWAARGSGKARKAVTDLEDAYKAGEDLYRAGLKDIDDTTAAAIKGLKDKKGKVADEVASKVSRADIEDLRIVQDEIRQARASGIADNVLTANLEKAGMGPTAFGVKTVDDILGLGPDWLGKSSPKYKSIAEKEALKYDDAIQAAEQSGKKAKEDFPAATYAVGGKQLTQEELVSELEKALMDLKKSQLQREGWAEFLLTPRIGKFGQPKGLPAWAARTWQMGTAQNNSPGTVPGSQELYQRILSDPRYYYLYDLIERGQ